MKTSSLRHTGGAVMDTLTEWFDVWVKPARKGWYQREWSSVLPHCLAEHAPDYWDGSNWYNGYGSDQVGNLSGQHLRWRGLAVKPEGFHV